MSENIDYSQTGKNKLEIEKLHEELTELRNPFRRWIGSLSGLLGIAAVAVSIIVTSNQITQSASEAAIKDQALTTREAIIDKKLAEFNKMKAENDLALAKESLAIAERKTKDAAKEMEVAAAKKLEAEAKTKDADKKLQAALSKLTETEKQAAELQTQAGNSQMLLERRKAELNAKEAELAQVIEETKQFAVTLTSKSASQTALKIAESSQALITDEANRLKLADDNTKARLFFFVLDSEQKENSLKLEGPLKQAGFTIANVLVFRGKREDTPVLRYFRDQDKAEADKIRDELINLGLKQTRSSRVIDPDSAGTGRKYQLWVTKENLRSSATEPAINSQITFNLDEYSIVSKRLTNGRWLSVYVANPNDDDQFRCVIYSSDKDETSELGTKRLFTAPPGSLFDGMLLPDKSRIKSKQPPFETDAFGGKMQVTIPSSSFRRATLQISLSSK